MTLESFAFIVGVGVMFAIHFVREFLSGWMGVMFLLFLSFCIATRLVGTKRRSNTKS